MSLNSFHKYVSSLRKSESFKPVAMKHPLLDYNRVVAKRNDKWSSYVLTSVGIKELQDIMGDGLIITSDLDTHEMYAYNMWI